MKAVTNDPPVPVWLIRICEDEKYYQLNLIRATKEPDEQRKVLKEIKAIKSEYLHPLAKSLAPTPNRAGKNAEVNPLNIKYLSVTY